MIRVGTEKVTGKGIARIYRNDCDEFVVRFFNDDNEYLPALDYFTDSRLDACHTAIDQLHDLKPADTADVLTRKHSAFGTFDALVNAAGDYRPSIDVADPEKEILADLYDEYQEARGDDRRAFRYNNKR